MSEQVQVAGRETTIHQTPNGKEVVIKTYLTGRERRAIKKVYTDNVKMITDETGVSKFEIIENADITGKSSDMLIQQAVTSYDGSTENIVDRILDAPSNEYDFVKDKCNALSKPEDDPKS